MKKILLMLPIAGLLLLPTPSLHAHEPTVLSQIITGAAIGTGTGLSFGLFNKYCPSYNGSTFLLTALMHNALVLETHKKDAGVILDVSAMIAAITWFMALNKSEFCAPTSTLVKTQNS